VSGEGEARQTPIENHGVIGDLATVALVGMCGSIDFLCWPRFDSPSVFAALLDPERGGRFRIAPLLDGARQRQLYLPDTNVLLTRFLSAEGVAEITDFMPVGDGGPRRVFRMVRTVRGEVRYRLRCEPRFDYARRGHRLELRADGREAWFRPEGAGLPTLRLAGPCAMRADGADAAAEFTLRAGETATFALEESEGDAPPPGESQVRAAFDATVAYWQRWINRSTYQGRWREVVHRSALALKLLTSEEHGSIVAAPTFGLPEQIGGGRNWDYRYTWVRDSAFVLYAFMRLGYTEEADRFVQWLRNRCTRCAGEDGTLKIMYGLDGRQDLREEELPHLAGYRGSRPVRIGNAASGQLQLDIYGELMDAVYLSNKYGEPISYDDWSGVLKTLDWVCENWRTPDEGIWEVRGGRKEFLHSRLMCWVAVDRGLRLAQKCSLPAPFVKLADTRSAIHRSIFEEFWDADAKAFVQAKGSKTLDAAALMMPLVRFVSPTDPRWLSTLDAIGARLVDDVLVRRYDLRDGASDGLDGEEGSFTTCSFWYVECLARAGRTAEARLAFEKTLGYANHLGLYAEELAPSGEHLGNFPQALTHLALISAACSLDRALAGGPRGPWSW
jgi:GH15 family glucan-1,4-alpha-glucosidase